MKFEVEEGEWLGACVVFIFVFITFFWIPSCLKEEADEREHEKLQETWKKTR